MWAFHHCPPVASLVGVLIAAVVSVGCRANQPVHDSGIVTWSAYYREQPVCRIKTHYGTKKVWLAAPRIREAEEGTLEIHGQFAVLAYGFGRLTEDQDFTETAAHLSLDGGGGRDCDTDGSKEAGALRVVPWGIPKGTLGLSVEPRLVLYDPPPDFMVRFVDETPPAAGCDAPRPDPTICTWSAVQKIVDAPDVKTTLWLAGPSLTRGEDGVIDVGGEFLVVVFELEWNTKVEERPQIRLHMSSDAGRSWIQRDFDRPHHGGGAFRLSANDSPPGAVAIAVVRGDSGEEPKWPGDFRIRFRK